MRTSFYPIKHSQDDTKVAVHFHKDQIVEESVSVNDTNVVLTKFFSFVAKSDSGEQCNSCLSFANLN